MKAKKKVIFIFQITDNLLKVAKCLAENKLKRVFSALEIETIPSDIDDNQLAERLRHIFNKLGYTNNPVIISLPRNQATCRYLKVPTQIPQEIEKIISLQAPRYLPYSANELITGYQAISVDKEGYSDINLIIVHKDVIERYLKIFKELKTARFTISLSSFGLCNLYGYIKPRQTDTAILIDFDSRQIELAVTANKKLLFSRYFKIIDQKANLENLFVDEIKKTQDVYLKEVSKEAPNRIVVLGAEKASSELIDTLSKQTSLPVEVLSYSDKINISDDSLNNISNSDSSFANMFGLGLEEIPASLNLLPQGIKQAYRKIYQRKERSWLILYISSIILILAVAMAKNLDNKAKYLAYVKTELKKIEKEAKPLEELEKRFEFIDNRLQKKPSSLDILYELHKSIPDEILLINFSYDEDNQIVMRGQAPELNFVFTFVEQLEKTAVFKNFNIKVRYATKRKVPTGEILDFEIVCTRK